MGARSSNILWLGWKELRGLAADPVLLLLVLFVFTVAVFSISQVKFEVEGAPVAVVDEDHSELSRRIVGSLLRPYFVPAVEIGADAIDRSMDSGRFLFILEIPPKFEQDVLADRRPTVQINVDATAMTQAGNGAVYLQNIITQEALSYTGRAEGAMTLPINVNFRSEYNPNLRTEWFNATMSIVSNLTLLAIVLTGAALLREREHGTVEHLLVMPVRPAEIMTAKIWANGVVIVLAATTSLLLVVHMLIGVPLAGSILLFVAGTVLYQVSVGALGILLATFTGTMGQFGLLVIPVIIVLDLLSGAATPLESIPQWLQNAMQFTPTTHYVAFVQAVLFRGGGVDIVWPELAALAAFGIAFFIVSLARFRTAIVSFQ